MAANVEIKARVREHSRMLARAREIAGEPVAVLRQEDRFYQVGDGRLKLRCIEGASAELIWYDRADEAGPKCSQYEIAPIEDAERLRAVLAPALGEIGMVRKVRTLFLLGQTRIHVDAVEGLGSFLELEVVLEGEQSVSEGQEIARDVMIRLGVAEADLVEGAYLDLQSSL